MLTFFSRSAVPHGARFCGSYAALVRFTLLVLVMPVLACRTEPTEPAEASATHDAAAASEPARFEWQTARPEDEGLDGERLAALTRHLDEGKWGNIHALLITRHGRLVYEEYFSGPDQSIEDSWSRVEFGPHTLHDIRSISKTVTAMLVGIALEEGILPSVETPLADLLPDHSGLFQGAKSQLTLRHVLTMSTGLRWDEDTLPYTDLRNDERSLSLSDDPVAFVLSRELVGAPGETFQYSGGSTLLLARIVERASGESVESYARTRLFEPLSIERWHWQATSKVEASPYAGLRMNARDLTKVGQLLADGGELGGRRILSEDWVRDAIRSHVDFADDDAPDYVLENGYGYQLWWNRFQFPSGVHEVASGAGNGEQRIIVIPHLSMVVTFLAGFYNDPGNWWTPENILMQEIVPAVRDESESSGTRDAA